MGADIRRIAAAPGVLLVASAVLVLGILKDLPPREGAYSGGQQGISLLVAAGAVVFLGHLAAHLYRRSGGLASACSVFGFRSLEFGRHATVTVESAGWPVLVSLLFSPFFVLLAGLGGWV